MSLLYSIAQGVYNGVVRDSLPRKDGIVGGVQVPDGFALLDFRSVVSDHENEIIDAAYQTIESGDDVVVLGGGTGVVAVHVARATGSEGAVVVYEPVPERAQQTRRTIEANHTPCPVSVEHAAVGTVSDRSRELFGDVDGVDHVPPREMARGDVAVVDIEGGECGLISKFPESFSRLVIETHGDAGCGTEMVLGQLDKHGWDAEQHSVQFPQRDIATVIARRDPE